MTQTCQLHYANRDLRNCSFREQDLTGADFSGSDIRGCDFSKTMLTGANFERVRTGQTLKQLVAQIAFAISFSIFFAFIFAGAFISGSEGFSPSSISSSISNTVIFIAASYIFTVNMLVAFNQNNTVSEIAFGTGTVVCIGFAIHFLLASIKAVRGATGTSFKNADLTNAKFNDSILQNVDFSEAKTTGINWTNSSLRGSILGLDTLLESD